MTSSSSPRFSKPLSPKGRTVAYLWVGLLIGAGFALLVAYPLVLVINSFMTIFLLAFLLIFLGPSAGA